MEKLLHCKNKCKQLHTVQIKWENCYTVKINGKIAHWHNKLGKLHTDTINGKIAHWQ